MARPHPLLLPLARGEDPPPGLDEARLVESAREHRMTGLLWDAIETGTVEISETTADEVRALDLAIWQRHGWLWAGLAAATDRLSAAGVRTMLIKGLALEHQWYSRMGARPCWDLDLVIHPDNTKDIDHIIELLQPDHHLIGGAGALAKNGVLQGLEVIFEGVPIDIHLDVLKNGPPSRRPELWWEDTVVLEAPAGAIETLSPAHALVHQTYHLARDRFRYLQGFVDLELLTNASPIDLDTVGAILAEEGVTEQVAVALDIVAGTVPLGFELNPPHTTRAALWRTLWPERIRLQGDLGKLKWTRRSQWLLPLTTRRNAARTARWWIRRALPPKEWLDHRHPGLSGPYLYRLVAGRVRHARGVRKMTQDA